MHISRLADIENRNVVPGLHKFYTLAALYHLNPLELFRWFEIPIEECFGDGSNFPVPRTHVAAPPSGCECRCDLIRDSIRGARIFCREWSKDGAISRGRSGKKIRGIVADISD